MGVRAFYLFLELGHQVVVVEELADAEVDLGLAEHVVGAASQEEVLADALCGGWWREVGGWVGWAGRRSSPSNKHVPRPSSRQCPRPGCRGCDSCPSFRRAWRVGRPRPSRGALCCAATCPWFGLACFFFAAVGGGGGEKKGTTAGLHARALRQGEPVGGRDGGWVGGGVSTRVVRMRWVGYREAPWPLAWVHGRFVVAHTRTDVLLCPCPSMAISTATCPATRTPTPPQAGTFRTHCHSRIPTRHPPTQALFCPTPQQRTSEPPQQRILPPRWQHKTNDQTTNNNTPGLCPAPPPPPPPAPPRPCLCPHFLFCPRRPAHAAAHVDTGVQARHTQGRGPHAGGPPPRLVPRARPRGQPHALRGAPGVLAVRSIV